NPQTRPAGVGPRTDQGFGRPRTRPCAHRRGALAPGPPERPVIPGPAGAAEPPRPRSGLHRRATTHTAPVRRTTPPHATPPPAAPRRTAPPRTAANLDDLWRHDQPELIKIRYWRPRAPNQHAAPHRTAAHRTAAQRSES